MFTYVKNLERQVGSLMKSINKLLNTVEENTDNVDKLMTEIKALNELFQGLNSKTSDDSKSKKYIR